MTSVGNVFDNNVEKLKKQPYVIFLLCKKKSIILIHSVIDLYKKNIRMNLILMTFTENQYKKKTLLQKHYERRILTKTK